MSLLLKFFIKNYDVISFDIFDTLIERRVNIPSDIFKLAGESILGKKKAEIFCSDRILAEKNARHYAKNGEVTLDEIYRYLNEKYPKEKELLKKEEIRQELNNCIRKQSIISAYEYAKSSGKIIVLISDMYLPIEIIEKMLKKCGVTGYKKCYISNIFKKNKRTGDLFKLVVQELDIYQGKMLHIGDSIKADFIGAYKAGVHPFLIGRKNRLGRLLQ